MNRFNIRVYGVLIDDLNRILLSDEFIKGGFFTKFPGGGLEFGEGTKDCLIREFKEETGLNISVGKHIYTTDFCQVSAFTTTDQIISIYYFVHSIDLSELKTSTKKFDFTTEQIADKNGQAESFRFMNFNELQIDDVSLPIDKVVVKILKQLEPL
ncbi:MAG: NUDIX hydrolase [Chitinophagales bacterium]|nr:NUDIX hydrolase [Chitinophagales bacterium]